VVDFMIKFVASIILTCVLSGCALEDARTARTAQQSLILTYVGNSTSNKGINLAGVVTLSGGGYCHATFKVKDGRVAEVHYSGETNATLAPDAYCAPIARGCVHQSEREGPTAVRQWNGRRADSENACPIPRCLQPARTPLPRRA
jgi:hypothetical protein